MPLDPNVQRFLEVFASLKIPDFSTLTPEKVRLILDKIFQASQVPTPLSLKKIENRKFSGPEGGIGIRLYIPRGKGPFPALVYFHGGGYVTGTLDQSDRLCQILAHGVGCVIISVDYRLAPEHRFPSAVEDGYAALLWSLSEAKSLEIDPERIGVIGDSAGAGLAAAVCIMARDRKRPPIICQILHYPMVDMNFDRPSYLKYGKDHFLTRTAMEWYWKHYLAFPEEGHNAYAAPLQAKDFSDLPPAYIAIGECDPLHDEGELFAKRLEEAGVPVECRTFEGLIHGFAKMSETIPAAGEALKETIKAAKKLLLI